MVLTFVTGNKDKLRETSQILGDFIDLQSQKIDLPELQVMKFPASNC